MTEFTCVSEFDHRFILTAIDAWYGNKEAFRDFVRGPLRDELLGLLPSPHLPPAYVALILSSAMATLLGFALNVYKAGAEIHQLVIFCVSEGAYRICWLWSALNGIFYLSDKTAHWGGCWIIDLAKALGVAIAITSWMALGFGWNIYIGQKKTLWPLVAMLLSQRLFHASFYWMSSQCARGM